MGVQPTWMPAAVVTVGWIMAWLVSFALASSRWVDDYVGTAITLLLGWLVASPLVAAALRWATPGAAPRRAWLVGLGWTACMLVGLGMPILLRLSYGGAALLLVGVAAAGLLATLAIAPPGRPIPWDRVLVVDAGWCAGWLLSGATVWPVAFEKLADSYVPNFAGLLEDVPFWTLVAGGILSGVVGGALMYLLLLRASAAADPR